MVTTIPRKLTKEDVPQLRDTIIAWHDLFQFPLDKGQLGLWASHYSYDVMRYAFTVTAGFLQRDPGRGKPLSQSEIYRYATGVMKKQKAAGQEVDALLGGAL